MKILFSSAACVFMITGVVREARAESPLPIPGTPKGELPTQLLQSRTYCRSLEWQLDQVSKRFPALAVDVAAARACWQSSAFAGGCNAIEEDIITKAGEKGTEMLKYLDEESAKTIEKLGRIETLEQALDFLALVDRRAKGEIEVDMVRATLLWNYKPFQEKPEEEFAAGFVKEVQHTFSSGMTIHFKVPMSWKTEESPTTELMTFRNCFGHGNVWMTVLVLATQDQTGLAISAQEAFDNYSEEALRAEYRTMGIELKSFMKTKVNGMPALLFTRRQEYEQLGVKAERAAEVIRAFKGDHKISFQINTLGPPDAPVVAAERIRKNEALFKSIGGSLRVMER
jgi:hypothetical protein